MRDHFILVCAFIEFADADRSAVKTLGRTIDALERALFRYVIGLVVLAPLCVRLDVDGIETSRPPLHAVRLVLAGPGTLRVSDPTCDHAPSKSDQFAR